MTILKPDEKVYLIKRRHYIVLFLQLAPLFLIFLIMTTAMGFLLFCGKISLPQFLIDYSIVFSNINLKFIILFFLSLLLSLLWVAGFLIFLDYYLDRWIITEQRTIYVQVKGLFHVTVSSVYYDKIQDITISVEGILPSLFKFGDIKIQSAGQAGQFTFYQIPEPEIVKQVILEAKIDYARLIQKTNL